MSPQAPDEPIAIVGMGCLFPGAPSPDAFWRNLLAGRDSTSDLTAGDLGIEPARIYDPRKGARDRTYWLRAGVVRDFPFDPHGFRLPPEEIEALDEVSRWSLHVARAALRDASRTDNLGRCGLVLGSLSFPTRTSHHAYAPLYWDTVEEALRDLLGRPDLTLPRPAARHVTAAGALLDTTPAEAVARALGLGGPTFCLDAACASSLYAIALACAYLRAGRADVMLAGAVSGADPFFITMGFSIFHAFPGDGAQSRPLDAASGGLTAGEGAGLVRLKRYADALRDGDRIYALVRGTGLSNDGRGKHVLVPSSRGQRLALERAHAAAGIEGRDVQYVECHATGTPAGDVVELNTVAAFYGPGGPLLGSVKSNFGHLLTAAGAAGTIKATLALDAGMIPPTIGIATPLSSENGIAGGERIVRVPTAWPDAARATGGPRRAGVSAFGFGGTNAHLVLEAPPSEAAAASGGQAVPLALPALEIVGLGAHAPGAPDVAAYERRLHEGRSAVGALPTARWMGIEREAAVLAAHGVSEGAPRGAYLSEFDVDFLRYRIPPNEDDQPIAQQLLLLTTADEAIRDAGLREGGAVGVVVAMETELELHRYRGRVEMEWQVRDALRAAGITLDPEEETALAELAKDAVNQNAKVNRYASFIGNIMATRVAAQWDFNGPCFTITYGTHSAHRAVEVAQLLLAQGEVEAVVVAGVSLAGSPEAVLLRARLGLTAVPGDGAAALVVRRAGERSDGDRVYATIDAALATSDGYEGLEGVERFDVPSTVAAEVGSPGVATGFFALVKAALCLHRRVLPVATEGAGGTWPWLSGAANGRTALVGWPDGPVLRLREASPAVERPLLDLQRFGEGAPQLLPIFAKTVEGLLAELGTLERALDERPLAQLAAERCARPLPERTPGMVLALVAADEGALRKEIDRARAGVPGAAARGEEWSTPSGSYFAARPLGGTGDVAFVYSGGISAYPGLGRDLFAGFPGLHDVLARRLGDPARTMAAELVYPRTAAPMDESERGAQERRLVEDAFGVAAAGASYALAATTVLRDVFKVTPRAAFGFSLGEASMLLALGVWSGTELADAAARIAPRVGQRISGRKDAAREAWGIGPEAAGDAFWQTYLVLASPPDVSAAVADEPRAFMTIVAGPKEVFIAGDPEACRRVIARLGCGHAPAPFNYVLHCPPVSGEQAHLAAMYRLPVGPLPDRAEVRFYSAAAEEPLRLDSDEIASRISEVVCRPLDFVALVERAYEGGARIFVEQGPGRACARWIRAILRDRPHVSISINQKGTDDRVSLVRLLACLVAHRVPLDLSALLPKVAEAVPEEAPARALIHRIVPGGEPIQDVILTEANVARFRRAAQRVAARESTILALAGGAATRATQSHTALVTTRHAAARAMAAGVQRQLDLMWGGPRTPTPATPVEPERSVVWDEADLLEFAGGEIARVFGPEYGVIDQYRRRVRLPLPPYLLVSRVTRINAQRGRYAPSTLTTEYDVPTNAWYSVDGQVPCAVAVESGQCDLLLISYLGIDFENRGERVYRLLDCTLTFLDDLPKEGDTLRYDISINSFARTGDALLFFFSYECFVGERLVLKMDGGCAGFFTDAELEQGRGVLYTEAERAARAARAAKWRAENASFVPPLHCRRRRFDAPAIAALSDGDLATCFGAAHDKHGRNPALRLPPAALRMFDRVTEVDAQGGAWGLGTIVAEKDLRPDDWYFPCHFQGDQVLAGSLMAEGCVQLLQFYLLYLGCHVLVEHARFQPILGLPQVVRCRGQVTPQHTKLTYRMEITELKRTPTPQAVASVEVLVDGKVVVHFENLGLRLAEDPRAPGRALPPPVRAPALLDERHLDAFATGRMADAFGPEFAVYDRRQVSRQPNGDLFLVSRVLRIDGTRGSVAPGASLVSEYDVPAEPWFHAESAGAGIPYSILMELGLQPCGILSAWLGSTLEYPETAFHFRNLDGTGRLLDRVDVRGRTIRNDVCLVSSTTLPGVIIQKFTYRLSCDGQPFYEGEAAFGHFEGAALAQQIGLDAGALTGAWHETQPAPPGSERVAIDFAPTGGHFDLLDRLVIDPTGGTFGHGYVYGSRPVNEADWFYACHFYQDPVMPGSLGVQAMVGALQTFALQQGLGRHLHTVRFGHPTGHSVVWKYRGQIVLTNEEMTLELHVKRIERGLSGRALVVADGSLWRDRLRIYEVTDLAITLEEGA